MSRSYWRYVLAAVGLTVVLALAAGYYELGNSEQQPYAQEKYQPARDARLPVSVPKSEIAAKEYRPHCLAPQTREDADLCAQWQSVEATEEGNRLARVNMRIAYFELAALVLTLAFTGWAAFAASGAARVAERALTDLERPFVYIEVTKSGVRHSAMKPFIHRDENLEFSAVNHGRTPADLWEVRDDIKIVPRDAWPEPLVPSHGGTRQLPPGTVSSPPRPFTFSINLFERVSMEGWEELGNARANLFLIGYLRYLDVFGDRYITGFCAIYDGIGGRFVLRGDERYNYTRKET